MELERAGLAFVGKDESGRRMEVCCEFTQLILFLLGGCLCIADGFLLSLHC